MSSGALDIPVAILAGGLATRLRPITETIPKILVPVAGRPFLAHQLELLRRQGIRRVVLCLGHLGQMVKEQFGDGGGYGIQLDYSFDGPVLLGTGGALRQALSQLGDRFFVLYGDSYLTADFHPIAEAFERSGKPGLMTVYRNEGLYDVSNVIFADGEIELYDKKRVLPTMRHIDYGLSLFRREAFEEFAPGTNIDLSEIMSRLVAHKQLAGYEVKERFYEIGTHAGLAELEARLKSGNRIEPTVNATRVAVFLDRDGVINRPVVRDGKPYPPQSPESFELLPGVVEACRLLKGHGFLLVVATNQPDVGRGTLSQKAVEAIHARMTGLLPIDRVEVCYDPGQGKPSEFRKPAPGMLLRAADQLGIDLARSFMVGDRWRDIDCGAAAGCRTIFVDYGYDEALRRQPDFWASNFLEAAQIILRNSK